MQLDRSLELWGRYEKVVAGASTYSKSPHRFTLGGFPIFLYGGQGCYVWDADTNSYIDTISALGPMVLGHADEDVNSAIAEQLERGISFSLLNEAELEFAELLLSFLPFEKVIYCKDGSDADSGAVRIARAYTGKEKVIYCDSGYYGWHSDLVFGEIKAGIPSCLSKLLVPFSYNDLESLEKAFKENKGEVAAVIMEPLTYEEPELDFLKGVRDIAHDNGALLIFDAIVTFPRFPFDMIDYSIADMVLVSKGIANGMPLACILGSDDILKVREEERVFFSGTFFGEALSMASAIATLKKVKEHDVPKTIWDNAAGLKGSFNNICRDYGLPYEMKGLPPRMRLVIPDPVEKALFFQETAKQGVLWGNITYLNYSHKKDIVETIINGTKIAMSVIKRAREEGKTREVLKGEPAREIEIRKD